MPRSNSPADATPLLVAHATLRTGEARIPGHYSRQLDVWVVDHAQGAMPLVECRQIPEILTKTHARVEEDDDTPFVMMEAVSQYPLELLTKTLAAPEQDDPSLDYLLELITKTNAVAEKDDTTDSTLDPECVDVSAPDVPR
ncbi:hypothetical protein ACVWYU_001943 [Pseudomonas sp. TE12234]|jgi:hypothetical protein|uniref:hypothetical protein n=1 Tax=Pseudomonas moorei TaxID=395599 RepID=UPI001FF2499C|nr:hypothetical protein [Pseudomonas moorei]